MSEAGLPIYTRDEFIKTIQDDASESCGIPLTVSEKRIKIIIGKAKRYFYQNYDGATQEEYVIIKNDAMQTPLFKSRRKIQLPKCIAAIIQLQESDNTRFYDQNPDKDYTANRYRLGTSLLASPEAVVYSLALEYWTEFARDLMLRSVSFDYSDLTNQLTILGRDNAKSLVATAEVYIPEEALFRDDLFYKYVLGRALKSIGKTTSAFGFNLIGGTQVDFSEAMEEGQEYIDEVKEAFDDQINNADFFVVGDQTI